MYCGDPKGQIYWVSIYSEQGAVMIIPDVVIHS